MKIFRIMFGVFILLTATMSCEKEQRVVLNEEEKVIYDSMFLEQTALNQILIDSMCEVRRSLHFNWLSISS